MKTTKQIKSREAARHEKKVAAKLKHPTALDPQPTRESAGLRVAAGEASNFYSNLKKEARRLGYKIPGKNQWDTQRIRIENEPDLAANIAAGLGNYSMHHIELARAALNINKSKD